MGVWDQRMAIVGTGSVGTSWNSSAAHHFNVRKPGDPMARSHNTWKGHAIEYEDSYICYIIDYLPNVTARQVNTRVQTAAGWRAGGECATQWLDAAHLKVHCPQKGP
jgi:hypothetical protein